MQKLKKAWQVVRKVTAFLLGGIGVVVMLVGMFLVFLAERVDSSYETFPF